MAISPVTECWVRGPACGCFASEDSQPLTGAQDKEWLSCKCQGYRNLAAPGGLFWAGKLDGRKKF